MKNEYDAKVIVDTIRRSPSDPRTASQRPKSLRQALCEEAPVEI